MPKPMQRTKTTTVTTKPTSSQPRRRRRPRRATQKASMSGQRPANAIVTRSINEAAKPRNDQMSFTRGIGSYIKSHGLGSLVGAYLKCIANPFEFKARIPDVYSDRTAIFHSIQSFNLPVLFNATPNNDDGRFSFAVRPILGQLSAVNRYQVAAVDCTKVPVWDDSVNWSDPAIYLGNQNGADPRLDPNAKFLAGNVTNYYSSTSTAGTPGKPINIATNVVSALSTNTFVTAQDTNFSWFYFPAGAWNVTLQSVVVGTGASDAQYALNAIIAGNPSPTTVPLSNVIRNPVAITNGATTAVSWSGVVTSQGSVGIFAPSIVNSGTQTVSTTLTVTSTVVTITATNTVTSQYAGNGVIETIRPVGMAAIVSYTGPTLIDGGQLSVGQYDNDFLESNFYAKSQTGQAQRFETLNTLEHTHVADHLKDGAYIWWYPRDVSSNTFRKVPEMNAYAFPGIICSGKISRPPNTAGPITGDFLRVRIAIAYEYCTLSTALDTETAPGTTSMVETALQIMSKQPRAMDNPKHRDWFSQLIRDTGRFIKDNQSWMGPLATGALALL